MSTTPGDPRRSGIGLLAAAGRVLLLLGGVALIAAAARGAGIGAGIFGALLLGLGLIGSALALREYGALGATQATLATSPDGASVTRVTSPGGMVHLRLASVLWPGLCAAAGAVLLAADARTTIALVVGVLALAVLAVGLIPVARGLEADRVDLSPSQLVLARHGQRIVLDWEDVLGSASPRRRGEPLAIVLKPGRTASPASSSWMLWPGHPRSPEGVVGVATSDLDIHPLLLSRTIALCADHPEYRTALGTPASLDLSTFPPVSA